MEFKVNGITIAIDVKSGLIESDWNLKQSEDWCYQTPDWGLIESDWNLKLTEIASLWLYPRINRIRLEFKVINCVCNRDYPKSGLIESDWNLKTAK